MIKADFLDKLNNEGKLELVEPSEEIKFSYLQKADNCLRAAKVLFQNNLHENSVSEAYYCMYNSLLALLFSVGIKCENHGASIILLKRLFKENDLFKIISFAKKERIDKQYYVEPKQKFKLTEDSCKDMIIKAEEFSIKTKLLTNKLSNETTNSIRKDFREMVK